MCTFENPFCIIVLRGFQYYDVTYVCFFFFCESCNKHLPVVSKLYMLSTTVEKIVKSYVFNVYYNDACNEKRSAGVSKPETVIETFNLNSRIFSSDHSIVFKKCLPRRISYRPRPAPSLRYASAKTSCLRLRTANDKQHLL